MPMKSTPAMSTKHKNAQSIESRLAAERKAFEQQRTRLMAKYACRYVALLNAQVVDNDKNDDELAERMFKKFGDAPFYIGHVTDTPSVYEMPSPELAG
jgi:triphosphoribosyl-dephospho-CoA synthetase